MLSLGDNHDTHSPHTNSLSQLSITEIQLERLIKEGAFEFKMGIRPSSQDFFRNSADPNAILLQRAHLITTAADKYIANSPQAQGPLSELIELVKNTNINFKADSLVALGTEWEPDFVILNRQDKQSFKITAGCVCFPSSWSLPEKIGLSLESTHEPVPRLNDKLSSKINSFLEHLKPGAVWERWNWGITANSNLDQHPSHADLERMNCYSTLDKSWFRAEHQVFCLLPRTNSVLFAIRVKVTPLQAIASRPELAHRLANQLLSMNEEIAVYKGLSTARSKLAMDLLSI
jgi:hypothetical protein